MKIATWNVNGVRAREAQLLEWVGREQPDVICVQELKATREQIPASLSGLADYWSFWHGERAYSGVALLVRKSCSPDEPRFTHPEFDHETRIVSATIAGINVSSIYVPNGGKDFAAKIRFLEALVAHAKGMTAAQQPFVFWRRPERGAPRDRCSPEGAQGHGDRATARGACAVRPPAGRRARRRRARARPGER